MTKIRGKNILAIYYMFPPIKGVGTLRNYKFYTSLKAQARKVFVLTTSNRHFLPQETYDIDFEHVYDIPTLDYRTLHHRLFNSKGSLLPNEQKKGQLTKSLLDSLSHPFVDKFIGEGGWLFRKNAIKKGQEIIDKEGIDVIISSYRPFAAHYVALQLKKKNPHIYWIADNRDLSTVTMNTDARLRKLHHKVNSKLFNHSDELITVSRGLQKKLREYNDNVNLIRNGIDSDSVIYVQPEQYPFFTFSYTGIIYKDLQRIDIFIKAIKNLIDKGQIDKNNVQFINAGKDGDYFRSEFKKYQLDDLLIDKGLIARKEVLEIQRKSHVNVLLTWATPELTGIVTAKIYEYLAAKNPIITIINGIKDQEIEDIIEGEGIGKVFYHDHMINNLEQYILQLYNRWLNGNSLKIKNSQLEKYMWDFQFKRWLNNDDTTINRKVI